MSRLSLKAMPNLEARLALTCHLLQWEKYLNRASSWRIMRAGMQLTDSKVAFYVTCLLWLVCGLIESAATIATGGSLTEAMIGVQWTTGSYSGLSALYMLRLRRQQLSRVLNDLAKCTYSLEKRGDPTTKEILNRGARWRLLQARFYVGYAVTSVLGVPATFITMRPHWAEAMVTLWAQASDVEPTPHMVLALQIAFAPVQAVGVLSVVFGFYTAIVLLFVLYGSTADLHRVIARGIETGPCTPTWAAIQSQLIGVSAAIRVAVADRVPHILEAGVVLPLFCTVDVLVNGGAAGGIALSSAPLVLLVLVASCEVGESVSSSLQRFTTDAYSGPWLEEGVAARRLRLQLMQASTVPSVQFHGRGVGVLNRRACKNVLRIWFRFLQAVLNFS